MKKSAFTLLMLVLAVGFADRGAAMAADLAPAATSAGQAVVAPGLPTLSGLDAAVAKPNAFITPGASSGTANVSVDANEQLGNERISLDPGTNYGTAGNYGSNEIPTSRGMQNSSGMMGPANRPQLDSNTAGRVINNSYNGDWFDYCGPKGNGCCSTIYGSLDAVLYDRKDSTLKQISLNSSTGASTLNTVDPNYRWDKVAPRLTLGRQFCDWAVEGSIIYKDDIGAHADTRPTTVGNTAVFFGVQPAGSNYTGSTAMRLDIYDGFHSYELNAVDTRSFFQMIYGFRYVEFREQLAVRSTSATGTSDAAIGTYNRMLGGQIGMRMEYVTDIVDLEFNIKGGIYGNDCNIGTNIRDINNTTLVRNAYREGQNEAYLAEANLMAKYRLTNNLQLRFGYQVMYITEIALAPDQISPIRTAAGNTTGLFTDAHGDMFMRGFAAGAEYRW